MARAILREIRDKALETFMIDGKDYKFWATPQRSKEERARNKQLVNLAARLQRAMINGEADNCKEGYTMVCWRGGSVIEESKES